MTNRLTISTVFVVLVALAMVLSPVAMAAGGATGTASGTDTGVDVGDLGADTVQTQSAGKVTIDPELERKASTGDTVEVVVNVESLDLAETAATDGAEVADQLEAHAERSQEPVVEYVEETDGVELLNRLWIANSVVVEIDTEVVDLADLAARDGVDRIHENYELEIPGEISKSAAGFDDIETTYGLDHVNATDVWEEYDTRGEGASVAVLDTGVDPDHPDIDIDPDNWAEIDSDGDQVASSPHDTGYHGTHVSGTITGGNASGSYIGVAPEAELMHGLVLPEGEGSFAQIIGGIEWAVEEDADVVSMSLGAADFHDEMIDPVQNAMNAGTLVVSSSGNDGVGTSGSPGNVYEAFAIGASDEDYGVADFSSGDIVDTQEDWGSDAPEHWPDEYVVPDVVAPGDEVRSAVPEGTFEDDPDVVYGYASGTSMAAPHVTGAAALAIAASGTDDPDDVSTAIEHSAQKPADCAPSCAPREGKDDRYGLGIIDSKIATDLLAANQGVNGTVTAPDGSGLEDITVELDGSYKAVTEDDGTFELRAPPGTYTLTAGSSTFGYTADPQTVTIAEDAFEPVDIELEETVDAQNLVDQADRIEAGDEITVESQVANVEALTVTAGGDYDTSDVTVSVNGEAADFGEPVSFDDYTGTLTIDVTTAGNTSGNLSLTQELEGLGGSVTIMSGPTRIVPELIPVGVVDVPDEDRVGANALINALEAPDGPLPVEYDLSIVETPDLRDSFGEYETYIVHSFGGYEPDTELIEDFVDETAGPDTGVVYLDQYALHANGVPALSETTGDPANTFHESSSADVDLTYDIQTDHPLVDGVGDVGDSVVIHDDFRNDHAWFEEFSGQTVATVSMDSEMAGPALAVDDLSRTVLASSLGYTSRIVIGDYTPEANQILTNAVTYADSSPPMNRTADQPAHVESGQPITQEFSVNHLEELEVGIGDTSTVGAENLTLLVDGTEAEFDQTIGYDSLSADSFNVTLVPDDDVVGTVATDLTFVGELGDSVLTSSGTTSIYDPPLVVGDTVDDIDAAQNLAPNDAHTTIYLEDGVYEDPVEITTNDITIEPVDGTTPTLAPGGDGDAVLTVEATNVDIRNLDLDASEIVDSEGDPGDGILLYGSENVTMTDLAVEGGDVGAHIRFAPGNVAESASNDIFLENATITGANQGVRLSDNTFGPPGNYVVSNTTVENSTDIGVEITAREATVRDSHVIGGDPAIQIAGADHGAVLEDTVIDGMGAEQGIFVGILAEDLTIRNNEIGNATTGIELFDFVVSGAITGNEVAADTGIDLDTVSDTAFTVRGNDLGESDLALDGTSGFDARLNYFGQGGLDGPPVADGIRYKPYLTSPLEDIDRSIDDLENTTEIGVDVEIPGGEVTALGVPGPTTQSVGDLLPEGTNGVIYSFDAESQAWVQVTGEDSLSALDAVMVVSDEDTHAHLEFQSDDEPTIPGQADLKEGWNFVAPPTYGGADGAFQHAIADITLISHVVERPAGQIGPAGQLEGMYDFSGEDPQISPFEGYFVFANDGTIPAELIANPTIPELYDQLDAGEPEPVGAGGDDDSDTASASTDGLVTAAD